MTLTHIVFHLRRATAIALAIICGLGFSPIQAQTVSESWEAAKYRGLTVGRSKRAEMVRLLGKPLRVEQPTEVPLSVAMRMRISVYHVSDPAPGTLAVATDEKSTIVGIVFRPDGLLTFERLNEILRAPFRKTRYDFDCSDDSGSGTLHVSPTGEIELIEYPSLGIAVKVDQAGSVDEITYLSKPPGSKAAGGPPAA